MAIESAMAASGLGVTPNPAVRRDEPTLESPSQRIDALASSQPPASDVAVQMTAPDVGQQTVLDRVGDTQQARSTLNQVQDSLIQQRQLATTAAEASDSEQADLADQQAALQAERSELVAGSVGTGVDGSPIGDLAVSLGEQELIGEADELPSAEQLASGIDELGAAQEALTDAEIALTAEFNAAQDDRLQGPAAAVTNPSEAESLLNRVLENENDLVRTSNAVDDEQRQQTLNLLTI